MVGENLRKLRKDAKLSQEQLAEKAGVSAKHIGALETGVSFISSDLLERFSTLFNVHPSVFFYEREANASEMNDSIIQEIEKIVSKKMDIATATIINETRRAVLSLDSNPGFLGD